jgi:sugar lactone lactonase YvrE
VKRQLALLAVAALVALTATSSAKGALVPITPVIAYDAAAGEFTEGITVDHYGNIYSGMALLGEIRRVAPDGTATTIAHLDVGQSGGLLLGLASDSNGNIYAALASQETATHGVWIVRPDGTASRYAALDPSGVPNGLTLDRRGNLYVSDATLGVIWRIPPGGGSAQLWAKDPLFAADPINGLGVGVNGLAFKDGQLYAANTDQALIARVRVNPDGSAGPTSLFAKGDDLRSADGIAFDTDGNVYVACSAGADKLVRVAPNATTTVLATAADGLDYSASLVFGSGPLGRTNLFISNVGLDFGHPGVLKAAIGIPGTPVL